jgi:hypothetical protein
MKMLRVLLVLAIVAIASSASAQAPPDWQAAAKVVLGDLEQGTPEATRPWSGELLQGWRMARAWRQHNNGNIEIIFAEYLTFTALCRAPGCPEETINGQPYASVAQQAMALKAEQGGPYGLASHAHAWLAGLADPTGAAAKNAALWSQDLDGAAADFATANLYALDWLLARARPTQAEQANSFSRLALFIQGKGWIGERCLDISRVATVIDAPPVVEMCK